MLVGYARVSTREQNHLLQLDALQAAGCERVYTEKASGAQRDRPELATRMTECRGRLESLQGGPVLKLAT